ncbi:MAG: polymer-forming cytoskeletal protein [Wujia sp.]
MGFFKDFKRDFAQAVNELMPDKDEQGNEYDDEDMVNTFDDEDNMDIAPEDMLDELEDFSLEAEMGTTEMVNTLDEPDVEQENNDIADEQSEFEGIPKAEVITEYNQINIEDFEGRFAQETELEETEVSDTLAKETVLEAALLDTSAEDELRQLEELDEDNMSENLEEALLAESENEATEATDHDDENVDVLESNMDIDKAVLDAMQKREDSLDTEDKAVSDNNNDWEDSMADIETKIIEEQNEQESNIDSILSDDTTYITKGTTIKGSIETEGGIDIIGIVDGDVICGGKLIVGGVIKGNVTAGQIYANAAKIEGEINSEGSVKIGVGSVVVGNLSSTSAVIAGAVNGDIDVHGPVIVDSTAVIMGNIKSRSVQINNGAVIEGFCSQCYSEIDVKSFFDLDSDK